MGPEKAIGYSQMIGKVDLDDEFQPSLTRQLLEPT